MREELMLSITGIAMVLVIIVGCSGGNDHPQVEKKPKTNKYLRYVCSCEQQARAASFVKETIKEANNMSDEEMEDVISQLERTSVRLHCSQKMVEYPIDSYQPLQVDSCQTIYRY